MSETEKIEKTENKVWIVCRVIGGCVGIYVVIIMNQPIPSSDGVGLSGRMTRYQCCTCNKIFTVFH